MTYMQPFDVPLSPFHFTVDPARLVAWVYLAKMQAMQARAAVSRHGPHAWNANRAQLSRNQGDDRRRFRGGDEVPGNSSSGEEIGVATQKETADDLRTVYRELTGMAHTLTLAQRLAMPPRFAGSPADAPVLDVRRQGYIK